MNREIKFRAWDGKEIRCDELFGGSYTLHSLLNGLGGHVFMQYTGIKDKNGKEIYEGDILLWHGPGNLPGGNKYVIRWSEEAGAWRPLGPDEHMSSEVIGNIWENPELLKQ